ncbi:MAG TPA: FkbM family methyltransferase [Aggregatilineales bacterium]|jgi:FkbM family methyltransferase|nr:FkbM family methyltransferase [Aggregatilineales bacterium]
MSVLDTGVNLYRKTFKRVRIVHVAAHRLMTHGVIPLLERVTGLRTMPDDPLWFRFELLLKRHEPETVAQIQRLVKPGMNVLDIGAHVGYYARMLGTLTGDGGRVYAFEPHPRTYKMLCANIAALNNVTPVNAAVAEQEGTAELFDYLMMSASGSLHFDESMRDLQKAQLGSGDIAPRIEHDFPVEKFTVRTLALDDFLAEKGVTHIDFIKMDIEGAEIGALRGLRRTIAQSPGLQLIMEYNPQALKAFGHDPAAAFDEVLALGFTRAQIVHEDGTLSDVQRDALAALTGQLMQNMGVVNVLLTR